ncbi:MAG: stage V sporulation protein AD, partial [Lachnospiraceae bacterium]
GKTFDCIVEDPYFGQDSWEESENEFQKRTATLAIEKAGLVPSDIRYIFAGDLLGQLIGTTFGLMSLEIPWFGLYGACSTMGESLSLGAMTVSAGYANYVVAMTSSHFGGAEKTFRYPMEYGSQRPLAATWTVTGSGAVVLSDKDGTVMVKGITTGKVVDYGLKDNMNMGAAMAPAAAHAIYQNFKDFNVKPDYYDKIITGDLGTVGSEILIKLLKDNHCQIGNLHMDCGCEIFDAKKQDTHAGGSGCGCSASVLCGYILEKIKSGEWKRVLFVPTGALLSTVSFNEGQSVPGIAHAVILEGGCQ